MQLSGAAEGVGAICYTFGGPDIHVTSCSHTRTVSWCENIIHLFLGCERAKDGGDKACTLTCLLYTSDAADE